jgi:DNA-binding LacI/PurR family transcriptional regulator
MTTIKDVAQRAGVGIGTVSRVLNDHPSVAAETRAKVREAIAALDYHPSRAARALSRQRAGTIAVVVPFVTHPSAIERLRGVLDALHDQPFDVVLLTIDQGDRRSTRLTRFTRRGVAEGLLLVSLPPTADEIHELLAARTPTVVVDAEAKGLPSFVIDDVEGGRLAARHLLDLGHHRVAYLGDTVDPRFGFTSSKRRRRGFAMELAAGGHPLDPELVREGPHDRFVARDLALELLTADQRPTAVFAHSDTQALGVLDAAAHLGLRVPADVSVIGFDDIEAAGLVGLTTVRQPLFRSGRLGAERLLGILAGTALPGPDRVELPLELVARSTTGPEATARTHRGSRARRRAS